MDARLTWTDYDEAGGYVVPNVLSPEDLVSRPGQNCTIITTELAAIERVKNGCIML